MANYRFSSDRRGVKFSDTDTLATYQEDSILQSIPNERGDEVMFSANKNAQFKMSHVRSRASIEASYKGRYLNIGPANGIKFDRQNAQSDGEMIDYVHLTNLTKEDVAFKVKTTSPDKFRVRPSVGMVGPGETVTVELALTKYVESISKDKFLILSVPTPHNVEHLNVFEMWKEIAKLQQGDEALNPTFDSLELGELANNIDQYRLNCYIIDPNNPKFDSRANTLPYVEEIYAFKDADIAELARRIDAVSNHVGSSQFFTSMFTRPADLKTQIPNFVLNFVLLYVMIKICDSALSWVLK